jgi:hypothetical protein
MKVYSRIKNHKKTIRYFTFWYHFGIILVSFCSAWSKSNNKQLNHVLSQLHSNLTDSILTPGCMDVVCVSVLHFRIVNIKSNEASTNSWPGFSLYKCTEAEIHRRITVSKQSVCFIKSR